MVAAAIIGGAVIGGVASSSSAGKAADAQIQSTDASIAVQREQFAAAQKLLKPYVDAGSPGGLRGGNMQAALSQFRPQVLSQMIEDKYSKLGGMVSFGGSATNNLASIGQASAAGEAAAGMNLASNVGNSITAAGDARANAALAQGQAWGNVGGSVSYLGGLGAQGYGPFGGSTPPPQSGNTWAQQAANAGVS